MTVCTRGNAHDVFGGRLGRGEFGAIAETAASEEALFHVTKSFEHFERMCVDALHGIGTHISRRHDDMQNAACHGQGEHATPGSKIIPRGSDMPRLAADLKPSLRPTPGSDESAEFSSLLLSESKRESTNAGCASFAPATATRKSATLVLAPDAGMSAGESSSVSLLCTPDVTGAKSEYHLTKKGGSNTQSISTNTKVQALRADHAEVKALCACSKDASGPSPNVSQLHVKVFKITGFPEFSGSMDKTDPYVNFILDDMPPVRTSMKNNAGGTVVYDETVTLHHRKQLAECVLRVQVLDSDTLIDDLIGEVGINLGTEYFLQTAQKIGYGLPFKMKDPMTGQECGTIYLACRDLTPHNSKPKQNRREWGNFFGSSKLISMLSRRRSQGVILSPGPVSDIDIISKGQTKNAHRNWSFFEMFETPREVVTVLSRRVREHHEDSETQDIADIHGVKQK